MRHRDPIAELQNCQALIARIDARGGPVPGTEERYEHARSWVIGHLAALQDHELGLGFLGVAAAGLVFGISAMLLYLGWQLRTSVKKGVESVIEEASRVGQVMVWAGGGLLLWQMFDRGRRRGAA